MEKRLTVCDCCETVIKEYSKQFHIKMMSEYFTDAAGQGGQVNVYELDFCPKCAERVHEALVLIASNLKED